MAIATTHQSFPPIPTNVPALGATETALLRWDGHDVARSTDDLAAEEPLEIRVRGRSVSVTMRTPGHDVELAVGFLCSEGLLRDRADVDRVAHCGNNDDGNLVDVLPAPLVPIDFDALTRHVFATSSCGLCGKATIEHVRRDVEPIESRMRIDSQTLSRLPETMRAAQATFDRTGGLHAAALFDACGHLRVLREDVGRHNAVDKVIGHALLQGWLPLADHVLLVSGRTSFEIVQKVMAARVPMLASVSAPSSLAVDLAREAGITLVGFLREQRMNVYAHEERIRFDPERAVQALRSSMHEAEGL